MGVKKSTVCTSASVGGDLVHAGVVGVIEADQYVGVVLPRQLAQHLVEHSRTQLGGAASGFDRLGEPDFDFGHENILEGNCRTCEFSQLTN